MPQKTRNPKSEIRKKPQARMARNCRAKRRFELRNSEFLRHSAFGIRICTYLTPSSLTSIVEDGCRGLEPDRHPSPCPLPARRGEGGRTPGEGKAERSPCMGISVT